MEYATDYLYEKLYEAINDSIRKAAALVKESPQCLAATNSIGETVLDHYARLNHLDKVKSLGELGALPSGIALRDATRAGQIDMIELLLKLGADTQIMEHKYAWIDEPPDEATIARVCELYKRFGFELSKDYFEKESSDWDKVFPEIN